VFRSVYHIVLSTFSFQIKPFPYHIMFPLIYCDFRLCRGFTFVSVVL
jgi:hypothetical protein